MNIYKQIIANPNNPMIDKFLFKQLASYDLGAAFKALGEYLETQPFQFNEFITQKGYYQLIQLQQIAGTIHLDDYVRHINIIRLGICNLVDILADVSVVTNDHFAGNLQIKGDKGADSNSNELTVDDIFHFPSPSYALENSHSDLPRLELELVSKGRSKKNLGLSRNNIPDEDGGIWAWNALYKNLITWHFTLIVRNNSIFPAYDPVLIFPAIKFTRLENLNKNEPIPGLTGNVPLRAAFEYRLESTGREAVDYMQSRKLPDGFQDLEILVQYKNEARELITDRFWISEGQGHNEIIKR